MPSGHVAKLLPAFAAVFPEFIALATYLARAEKPSSKRRNRSRSPRERVKGRTSAEGLLWDGWPKPKSLKGAMNQTGDRSSRSRHDRAGGTVWPQSVPSSLASEARSRAEFPGRRRGATPHKQTAARCRSDVSVGEGRSTTSPAQRSRRDASRRGSRYQTADSGTRRPMAGPPQRADG